MNLILLGAIIMASSTISLFFFKYWRQTGDRFFAFFSLAFLGETLIRIAMAPVFHADEYEPFIYSVRLFSFALIILAIADKNRRSESQK